MNRQTKRMARHHVKQIQQRYRLAEWLKERDLIEVLHWQEGVHTPYLSRGRYGGLLVSADGRDLGIALLQEGKEGFVVYPDQIGGLMRWRPGIESELERFADEWPLVHPAIGRVPVTGP